MRKIYTPIKELQYIPIVTIFTVPYVVSCYIYTVCGVYMCESYRTAPQKHTHTLHLHHCLSAFDLEPKFSTFSQHFGMKKEKTQKHKTADGMHYHQSSTMLLLFIF